MNAPTPEPNVPEVNVDALLDKHGKFLLGDFRDFLLTQVKKHAPWAAMTEKQQKEVIDASTAAATNFIERAVNIIASNGQPVMRAVLAQITIKDGIEAKVKMSKHDPMRHELIDAQGSTLFISVVDTTPFSETRGDVKPEPDQRRLPIAEDTLPAADPDTGEIYERDVDPETGEIRKLPEVKDDGGTDDDPDDNDDD